MKRKLSPYILIILSFLSVILIGSFLLVLPISLNKGVNIKYIDALFTSSSAVTITGLSTISIYDTFNTFGKIVIAILIQVGGLSITTIALFIMAVFGAKIGFSSRDFFKESMNISSFKGIIHILKRVVLLSLVVEFVGFIIFTIIFASSGYGVFSSMGKAAFHAISSYNNAGFDIFSNNNSLMMFSNNWLFNLTTISLITIGGLGAIVIFDVLEKKSIKKLEVHTKIVLKVSAILFLVSSLSFYLLEKDATILQALFHAATIRTAGFYSYNYLNITTATMLLTVIFMYIGAAPASTGGGIKVTTAYTLYKGAGSYVKQKDSIAYNRKIPESYQKRSFTILLLSLSTNIFLLLMLLISEPNIGFSQLFFEVFSAFSNTGLTLGITTILNSFSKFILIVLMFIGRVGILTLFSSMFYKYHSRVQNVDYIDISYILG